MTRSVSYTYAVARYVDGLRRTLRGLHGVGGEPVHLVEPTHGAGPVAVVSPVPEQDFEESALRRHLEDLEWLEDLARAHHGVIEAIAARTTVLPLRLATVYLDDIRVRAVLDERQSVFDEQLSHLADHLEWGVKLYVDQPTTPAGPPPNPEPGSGRAYLRQRRAQRDSRQDAYQAAERAARRIETAARAYAVERVRHRPQEGQLAVGPGVNVSNDAYLVPLDHAEPFRTDVLHSIDGLAGVRVEVTGPWAPYSFAALQQAQEAAP
ncbi:GvpL/GvpF family gas vesicle protein [Kitasatospora sp. NPDC051984]|uniref:GvpL/GvpF family gas vesicle protein n=1 Tax=Kitasatospora sp. NPDC051984 TaxID=3364059 RepID=UPI0037C70089